MRITKSLGLIVFLACGMYIPGEGVCVLGGGGGGGGLGICGWRNLKLTSPNPKPLTLNPKPLNPKP